MDISKDVDAARLAELLDEASITLMNARSVAAADWDLWGAVEKVRAEAEELRQAVEVVRQRRG